MINPLSVLFSSLLILAESPDSWSCCEIRTQLLEDWKVSDSVIAPQWIEEDIEVDLSGVWYMISQGELDEAELELERFRRQLLVWEPPYAIMEVIKVRALFQSGRLDEAVRLLSYSDADIGLRRELVGLLTARAFTEVRLANWKRAFEFGMQVDEFEPMDWSALGWIAFDLENPIEALRFFEQAIGGPFEESALRGRVRSLMALGELNHAENLARRIGIFDDLETDLADLHAAQALTAAEELRWNDASLSAKEADRLGTSVWLAVGWIALEQSRPDLALKFIESERSQPDGQDFDELRALTLKAMTADEPSSSSARDNEPNRSSDN